MNPIINIKMSKNPFYYGNIKLGDKVYESSYETNINKLHSLIASSTNHRQTFIENLKLWRSFYNARITIIKENFLNPKLFDIIKFLLEQENGEIFDYFHSELIETLGKTQEALTFKLRDAKEKSSSDIDLLFNNIKLHDDLVETLKSFQIEDVFGEIKKYSSKTLELYTIDSLMMIIYDKFFELEPEVVRKALEFITKNIVSLQKDDVSKNSMNVDALFQYFTKILPIKKFIGEDIANDELIVQVKKQQIKEKKLLLKIFNILSVETVLEIFEEDANNFLAFLTNVDYLSETVKYSIALSFFDKMLKEKKYIDLMRLIVNNNQNPLWKKYVSIESNYNRIIIGSLNTPIFYMDSDMIKYLLTSELHLNMSVATPYNYVVEHTISKNFFKYECQYLIRKKDFLEPSFDIEGVAQILSTSSNKTLSNEELTINQEDATFIKEIKTTNRLSLGLDIDFNTSIELLGKYFQDKVKLSNISVLAIIRSIALEFQKQLGIENNGLYYFQENSKKGAFYPGVVSISINRALTNRFLVSKLPLYQRLKIFVTTFHEIKHAKINQNRQDNIWDMDAYEMEKEQIMRSYDAEFYHSNYKKVKEEISARISGYNSLLKFIETFFPQYLDQIQDSIIKELEIEKALDKEQNSKRVMQFFKEQQMRFNIAFDKLLRYNPTIVLEHPILQLEYYSNGTPKTYEDIRQSRTEDNKDLINGILKNRYPNEETYYALGPRQSK